MIGTVFLWALTVATVAYYFKQFFDEMKSRIFDKEERHELETALPAGRYDDHQRLLSQYRAAGL